MKRFAVFVVLAMVVIGPCAAQSANNDAQKLVGTWVNENRNDAVTLVFNANGTGTWNSDNFFWGVSTSGVLYIKYNNNDSDGGTFYLSPDGRRMIYSDRVYQKR